MRRKPASPKLLTVRAALILAISLLAALGAGLLTYWRDSALPTSMLTACGVWAAAVIFLNELIEGR